LDCKLNVAFQHPTPLITTIAVKWHTFLSSVGKDVTDYLSVLGGTVT